MDGLHETKDRRARPELEAAIANVHSPTHSQRVDVPFGYCARSVAGQEPGLVRATTPTSNWQLKPQELK